MLKKLFSIPKPHTPIIAWSLYDFANTAFAALIITVGFPILIKHLGGTEFHIGLSMGISLLIAAFSVPFIGAVADAFGKRIPLLIFTTLVTGLLTAMTGFTTLGIALVFGALANLFNNLGVDLYNSFIPDLAPPHARGRLSGFGAAIGYLGTIASLFMAFALFSFFGFESFAGIQSLFVGTAIFLLVFSIPLFIFVKDKKQIKTSLPTAIKKAYSEIKFTLTHIREIKGLGSFLGASFFYNDAMHTVIIFLSLYGTTQVGLSLKEFFLAFSLMSLAAFFGSLIFGKISDARKPKKTLIVILLLWIGVIFTLMFADNLIVFLIASSMGGALLGGVWTCNRHMVTLISPPHKMAEIFGFEGLTEKAAGVIGPIGFGLIVTHYGYTPALFFLLALLTIGLFILWKFVPDIRESF